MGKTITSITHSKIHNIRRTIIVCPASVKWSIFRDLTDNWGFNPLYFTMLDAAKQRRIQAFQERFVIINYDILGKFMTYLLSEPAGHIICDEQHKVKDVNSLRFKLMAELVAGQPNARVTLMSGTPIRNRPNDIFAPLKLCKQPLGENHAQFLREFTKSKLTRGKISVTGGKNIDQLHSALSNFMIRRTKKECLADLPDVTVTKYYIKDDEWKAEYNRILEEIMAGRIENMSINGSMHSLNRHVAMAKLKASPGIIDLIDDITENGQKVVVFSFYKNVLETLKEHYKERAVMIHGGVNTTQRDMAIKKFREDESVDVFIGQTDAAGEGIDLTTASDVIFCDFPFTSTQLDQALSRVHRSRQKNAVNVYYCMVDGEENIDDVLFRLVASKAADIAAAIDRDKPLAVDYGNIGEQLFNELFKSYKKEHHVI